MQYRFEYKALDLPIARFRECTRLTWIKDTRAFILFYKYSKENRAPVAVVGEDGFYISIGRPSHLNDRKFMNYIDLWYGFLAGWNAHGDAFY